MPKPPVQLPPRVQQRLLEQMREEQASQMRSNQLRNYVLFPVIGCMTIAGAVMAFSDDSTTAMLGNLFASSVLWLLWMLRKRIGGAFGE